MGVATKQNSGGIQMLRDLAKVLFFLWHKLNNAMANGDLLSHERKCSPVKTRSCVPHKVIAHKYLHGLWCHTLREVVEKAAEFPTLRPHVEHRDP